jgi:hypothetical protein
MFCVVFFVVTAILICVSLNSFVMFILSFQLYVKMANLFSGVVGRRPYSVSVRLDVFPFCLYYNYCYTNCFINYSSFLLLL